MKSPTRRRHGDEMLRAVGPFRAIRRQHGPTHGPRTSYLTLAVVVVLFATACTPIDGNAEPNGTATSSVPGAPDGDTTPSPGVSAPSTTSPQIDAEERAAVIDDVVEFAAAVTGDDGDEAHIQIAEYLRSRLEFVDAGVSEDDIVWGVFADGGLYVHIDNAYDRTEEEVAGGAAIGLTASMPAAADGGRFVPALAAQASGGSTIPASTKAVILEAYGPMDEGAGDLVGPWLTDAGYSVSRYDATIDELLSVGSSGIFLYNGHGGTVPRPFHKNESPAFVLTSTTPITPEGNVAYAAQLEAGEMAWASVAWEVNVAFAPEDPECLALLPGERKPLKCQSRKHRSVYAITDKVVEEWHFADGALVVLNACTSTALSGVITRAGNVGAFVGWDRPVAIRGAPIVLALFFDRLLGINTTPPNEWPDMRPFDAGSVFKYMEERKKIVDPVNKKAKLSVVDLGQTILIPSIKFMEVHEDSNELFVEGLFGTRPGTIKIGTTEKDAADWSAETVVVKIEDTGPTAAGEVTVIVDGRKSNPVPLTQWRGKMYYSADIDGLAKGLEADVVFDVHLRADVHMYRDVPWEEPAERRVEIRAVGDSTGPWEVSGSASNQGATFTLTGSGILEAEETQPDHEGALFAIFGTLVSGNPGTPPTVEDLRIHAHFSSDSEARLKIEAPGAPAMESGFPLPQSSILNNVPFRFRSDFGIEASQVEGQSMGISGPVILYWDDLPAMFQPSIENPPQAGAGDPTASSAQIINHWTSVGVTLAWRPIG
ncbi:MAG: hypothetical protein P1T08_10415 [Acidimicrobiia bacterium]|nr:hypothetical protein [Acidimicrobiia bacterium]